MIKRLTPAVWMAVVCLGLFGVSPLAAQKEAAKEAPPVKIGLIAELTGELTAVGASCKKAAELAVNRFNEAGGVRIGGQNHRIELVIEDSGTDPERAAAAVKKLIEQDKVLAIIGPNASGNAIPAADAAERAGVLLITPWSTSPKTTLDAETGKPKKYVFRACFTDTFEGQILAKFAREHFKATRAAVLYEDIGYGALKGQTGQFPKSFEAAGGKVAALEKYPSGAQDFTPQLTRIKAAAPDVLFLPGYYKDIPLQANQAAAVGLKLPVLGSDAWGTGELTRACGTACEGFYLCSHYSPDSANPLTKKFVALYRSQFLETPDDVAALTYDAFGLLAQALAKSPKPDREMVRKGMSQIRSFQGATGEIRFLPGSGDPLKEAVILRIQEGKFVWAADVRP
jgi:branched-chain amino acid transport system substrate-binding protein